MDVGRDIQYTSDGGFIIAGTTSSFGVGNTAVYLIKTDSIGSYLWSKAIGGIGVEWGYSIKQTYDGGYIAAGYTNSFGNGGYDMYLIKTDTIGNILWEKSYGGKDWDFGYSVIQTPDSGFVLCGETYSFGNGNQDVYLVRTNKFGDTLWTKTFGGTGKDIAHFLLNYNDSLFVLAGETNSFTNGNSDVYFISANYNGIWSSEKIIGTTLNDIGNACTKASDGGIVIFGETDSSTAAATGKNELLLKIDLQGTTQWIFVYGNAGENIGRAIKEKSNGDLITCGSNNPSGLGGSGLQMMMMNNSGWWLNGPAFGNVGDEFGYSLTITPSNKAAFIGSTTSAVYTQGLEDVYLILLQNDNIVMNYSLVVNQFQDTLSPISVGENTLETNVFLHPNPFSEYSFLTIDNWHVQQLKSVELKIQDISGRVIHKSEIKSSTHKISSNNMNAGMYFFSLSSDKRIIHSGKLIIE